MKSEYQISNLKEFKNISSKLRKIHSSTELEFRGKELSGLTENKEARVTFIKNKPALSRVNLPERFKSYMNKNKLLIEQKSLVNNNDIKYESENGDFSMPIFTSQSERGKEDLNPDRISISIMTEKALKPLEISSSPSKVNMAPKLYSNLKNNKNFCTITRIPSKQQYPHQTKIDLKNTYSPNYFQIRPNISASSLIFPYQVLVPTYNYIWPYSENFYQDFHSLRNFGVETKEIQKNVNLGKEKEIEKKIEHSKISTNSIDKTFGNDLGNFSEEQALNAFKSQFTKAKVSVNKINANQNVIKQISKPEAMICQKQKSVYINLSNSENNLSLSEIFNQLPQSKKLTKPIRNSETNCVTHKTKIDLKNIRKEMLKSKRSIIENNKKNKLLTPQISTPIKQKENSIQLDLKKEGKNNLKQKNKEKLVERLSSGKKVEISKKSMINLTTKNYNKLPEVKQKKIQKDRQKEIMDRIQKSRMVFKVSLIRNIVG